jgi:ribonucleotide reductase alpha subunit
MLQTKSNQNNLGTIQCSNLCMEIIQYTAQEANLASMYVVSDRGPLGSINPESGRAYFDREGLHRIIKIVTQNLNIVIDINSYPVADKLTAMHVYAWKKGLKVREPFARLQDCALLLIRWFR